MVINHNHENGRDGDHDCGYRMTIFTHCPYPPTRICKFYTKILLSHSIFHQNMAPTFLLQSNVGILTVGALVQKERKFY